MLLAAVSRVVRFCTRYPWLVIVAVLALTVASSVYAATHFAINTDITKLISPDLAWRQRDKAFEKEFPGHFASTLVVVDAPTPELVSAATGELVKRLDGHPDLFEAVEDLAGGSFFARNGLMFQPTQQVIQLTQGLGTAAPLIDVLHGDPSLRGLLSGLNLGLAGVVLVNGLASGAALVAPWLLGRIIDTIRAGGGLSTVDRLAFAALVFTVVQTVLSWWALKIGYRFGERTAARVRERSSTSTTFRSRR